MGGLPHAGSTRLQSEKRAVGIRFWTSNISVPGRRGIDAVDACTWSRSESVPLAYQFFRS